MSIRVEYAESVLDVRPSDTVIKKKMWNANTQEFENVTLVRVPLDRNSVERMTEMYGPPSQARWQPGKLWYTTFDKLVMDESLYTFYKLKWA